MKNKLLQKLVCYTLAMSLMWSFNSHSYDQAFICHVINNNINTLITVKPNPEPSVPDTIVGNLIQTLALPRKLKLKNLNSRDKRTIIFEQVQPELNADDTIIDQFFVDKMGLVHGYTNPDDHLVNRLCTDLQNNMLLKTEIGIKRFIEILVQPTINIQTLYNRQTIIKELVENDALRIQCMQLLDTIQSVEPYFFTLYSKEGLEKSEQSLLKFQSFFTKLGWNKISALTLSTRSLQLLQTFGVLSLIMFALGAVMGTSQRILNYAQTNGFQNILHDIDNSLRLYATSTSFNERMNDARKVTAEAFFICTSPFQILLGLNELKDYIEEILNIQELLMGFATYLHTANKLFHLFDNNLSIKHSMPHLQSARQELVHCPSASEEFNQLNDILQKDIFAQENPSFFSSPGNILTAYKHIAQPSIRKEYSTILNALGEIDAYVALANKIKAHQEYPATCAQFCFVQFQENAPYPLLNAINFWNPFIGHKKIACNDISLNIGNERNILLTGTNTGGKSTLLKAIMIALLLIHTFGIAPAEAFTIALFHKLIIDMNITDDIGAGLSLFKAEVERAHEVLNTIQKLSPNEFAFIIIDEIFRGTSHDTGENLAFHFMEQLNRFKNCLFITATHFEKLVTLEQTTNGEIKNYHMDVEVDADGNVIKYTHKIKPGPSPVVNAEQVAAELLLDYVVSFT